MSRPWTFEQLPIVSSIADLVRLLNQRLMALDGAVRRTAATLRTGDTSPSVLGLDVVTTNNTGATSIVTFTQGFAGKMITLIAGDGNTTLVQGTTLKLLSGGNVTMASGDVRAFVTADGVVWREVR